LAVSAISRFSRIGLSCAAVPGRLDSRLLYAMRTRFHGRRAETVAKTLGRVGEYGAIWLVIGIALAFIDPDNGEDWIVAGLLGPVSIGLNFAVKVIVRRPRPVLEGLPPLGGAPSSLSFPSAHATSSFACATYMTRIAPEAAVLFALAAAIAVCRPYLGMHYPSDVLAGIVLGTALGLVVPL
jgi:membrane-associated phospholipid phosphatase